MKDATSTEAEQPITSYDNRTASNAVPEKTIERSLTVTINPKKELSLKDIDLLNVLRNIQNNHQVRTVSMKAAALPSLEQLIPENCYLTWRIELDTTWISDHLLNHNVPLDPRVGMTISPGHLGIIKQAPECWITITKFAQYLVNQQIISVNEILKAHEYRLTHRATESSVAVETGLVTPDESFEILQNSEGLCDFASTALKLR
jgi:hypothetical protein